MSKHNGLVGREVTLVGSKGVQLPITSGVLVAESDTALIFSVDLRVGRGKSATIVRRQYCIPRSFLYFYADDAVVGEETVVDAPRKTRVSTKSKEATAKTKEPKKGKKRTKTTEGENPSVAIVLAALEEADAPVGMGGLKEATQLDASDIRVALKELEASRKIKKSGEKRGTVYFVKGASKKVTKEPKQEKEPKDGKKVKKVKEPKKGKKRNEAGVDEDVKNSVLTVLQDADEPIGMGVIKGNTGLDPATIRTVLRELEDSGTVTRSGEKRGTVYSMSNGVKASSAPKKTSSGKPAKGESKAPREVNFKGASLFTEDL